MFPRAHSDTRTCRTWWLRPADLGTSPAPKTWTSEVLCLRGSDQAPHSTTRYSRQVDLYLLLPGITLICWWLVDALSGSPWTGASSWSNDDSLRKYSCGSRQWARTGTRGYRDARRCWIGRCQRVLERWISGDLRPLYSLLHCTCFWIIPEFRLEGNTFLCWMASSLEFTP